MPKTAVRSGLTHGQLRRRLSETHAAQLPVFEGTASLVSLAASPTRVLSASGVARALRRVQLPEDEPVFVAVPQLTADALAYMESLDLCLLRDPPQSVITRSDDDVATS